MSVPFPISLDTTSQATAVNTSVTLTHTCAAGAVLYVSVFDRTNFSSITCNGQSMELLKEQSNSNVHVALYRTTTPATGSNSVVLTASSSTRLSLGGISFINADKKTNGLSGSTYGSTTGRKTVTLTPETREGAWVIGTVGTQDWNMGIQQSAISGQTYYAIMENNDGATGSVYGSTPTEISFDLVNNNRDFAMVAVEVLPRFQTGALPTFIQ